MIGSTASANNLKAQPAVTRAPTGVPAAVRPAAVAQKPAPKAVPTAATDNVPDALEALENWRRAWASKDVAAYLAAYAADFRGTSPSRTAWVSQREARINKPVNLDIRISDARIEPVNDKQVRVRFRQHYQAGSYRANTMKSLLMVLDQGKWLIREERALR